MAGTITTRAYCLTRNGLAYVGSTKEEALSAACSFGIDENRRLFIHVPGYGPRTYLSYSDDWPEDDLRRCIIDDVWVRIEHFGFQKWRDLGH